MVNADGEKMSHNKNNVLKWYLGEGEAFHSLLDKGDNKHYCVISMCLCVLVFIFVSTNMDM